MNNTRDEMTSLDIRLVHLEDQVNAMNTVLAAQGRELDTLNDKLSSVKTSLASIEKLMEQILGASDQGIGDFSTSDHPPDGANR